MTQLAGARALMTDSVLLKQANLLYLQLSSETQSITIGLIIGMDGIFMRLPSRSKTTGVMTGTGASKVDEEANCWSVDMET